MSSSESTMDRASLHATSGRHSVHMCAPEMGVVALVAMDTKEGDPVVLIQMTPEDALAWLESMKRVCMRSLPGWRCADE